MAGCKLAIIFRKVNRQSPFVDNTPDASKTRLRKRLQVSVYC
jgi:hypothetical protein